MISDTELAWQLADAAGASVHRSQRALLFVELGSGDYIPAIERVLTVAATKRITLSPTVITEVAKWLDRYDGYAHEVRLRPLLARIPTAIPAPLSS